MRIEEPDLFSESHMNSPAKQALVDLAQQLPQDCSWDEVMSQLYIRQKIQQGLSDVEAGRLHTTDEVFAEHANADTSAAVDEHRPA